MPPKGYARRAPIGPTPAKRDALGAEDSAAALEQLRRRRKALEDRLEAIDVRVYEFESAYLRRCVELGGALFDGFGVERQQWAAAAPAPFSAYRERLQTFTPNDRVFSASSLGALGVVERVKAAAAIRARCGRQKREREEEM